MSDTALQPYEGKRPILMKSGLVHWVSEATASKLENQLATQAAHCFIKISELGLTINSAEIDGVYTREQYTEYSNVKQGMWKCEYGNWHNKGKRECECRAEFFKKQREKEQREKEARENKPLSPEEQKAQRERMRLMNEESALKGSDLFIGLFRPGNQAGRKMRRSTIKKWEETNGPVDQNILSRMAIEEDLEEAHNEEAHAVFN